jgi:hypothetical protein
MNKSRRVVTIVSIISIATIIAISYPLTSAKAASEHGHHGQVDEMDMKNHMKAKPLSLEKIHSTHLPMLSRSIENAIKAIEAGNKGVALVELRNIQKIFVSIKEVIGKHVKPKFANARCPIMGSPINPDKVAKNLIRDYKDQKVAFCCGGCPATWDKLTDAEKTAKLAKVMAMPAATKDHSAHKH